MFTWEKLINEYRAFFGKYGAALLIAFFFVLEAAAIAPAVGKAGPEDLLIHRGPVVQEEAAVSIPDRIPKLSEMRGPRIDDEAAMIVVEESVAALPACTTLPAGVWVFLLAAYVALMVFNLSFGFAHPIVAHRIQWFWEVLYTVAFIGMWYAWDGCQGAEWYPLAILRMGVFLYAVYLYFFDRRMRQ
jgi:hypothetical protein